MADRTPGSDDMQAEARELAEDEALERWESVHGPFNDETEDWRDASLTAGERNR